MLQDFAHKVKVTLISLLDEDELISHSRHPQLERFFLTLRNIAAALAVFVFLLSLLTDLPIYTKLKAVGYFFGAAAYLFEMALLTDCFTEEVDHKEMFMAYCFGPLYVLMGISYLTGH
ncbi:MAG: hypothetical protein IKB53_04730 [Oscillospiraceae bacterium]|nr:hypothetical protein [Oscillospiraceae bacterium]